MSARTAMDQRRANVEAWKAEKLNLINKYAAENRANQHRRGLSPRALPDNYFQPLQQVHTGDTPRGFLSNSGSSSASTPQRKPPLSPNPEKAAPVPKRDTKSAVAAKPSAARTTTSAAAVARQNTIARVYSAAPKGSTATQLNRQRKPVNSVATRPSASTKPVTSTAAQKSGVAPTKKPLSTQPQSAKASPRDIVVLNMRTSASAPTSARTSNTKTTTSKPTPTIPPLRLNKLSEPESLSRGVLSSRGQKSVSEAATMQLQELQNEQLLHIQSQNDELNVKLDETLRKVYSLEALVIHLLQRTSDTRENRDDDDDDDDRANLFPISPIFRRTTPSNPHSHQKHNTATPHSQTNGIGSSNRLQVNGIQHLTDSFVDDSIIAINHFRVQQMAEPQTEATVIQQMLNTPTAATPPPQHPIESQSEEKMMSAISRVKLLENQVLSLTKERDELSNQVISLQNSLTPRDTIPNTKPAAESNQLTESATRESTQTAKGAVDDEHDSLHSSTPTTNDRGTNVKELAHRDSDSPVVQTTATQRTYPIVAQVTLDTSLDDLSIQDSLTDLQSEGIDGIKPINSEGVWKSNPQSTVTNTGDGVDQ